ncbi:prolyl hydroxylase family protein [Aestuariibacter salexigens]|uniref:prolyl hydroxylase family protein n=1 Tax=Aestuariibacter salexigens TaxID=226010 RepID=UPI0004172EC1|nr:2OG-Fe(II) oxygenase [Aestuariibacter salexigens]
MTLPAAWKKWVLDNLLRGVDPEHLYATLMENGFTFEACKSVLGNNLPSTLKHVEDGAFFKRLSEPDLINKAQKADVKPIQSDKIQLYRIDNFLTAAECLALVELTKTKLRPSEISTVSPNTYQTFRTSSSCDLPYTNDPLAEQIDRKIIDYMGLIGGHDEVIQAQHYDIGQQFKAHTDYFQPGSEEYKKFCAEQGQRTWTFMIYLNEDCEGGQTEFVRLGHSFKPTLGTALAWNNLYPDGTVNPDTLHHAHPVTAGEKVIITKWFRVRNRSLSQPQRNA